MFKSAILLRTPSLLKLIYLFLLLPPALSWGQTSRTVTLAFPETSLQLTFIECPAGTMIDGRPGADLSTETETSGFGIMQTEVSFSHIIKVLGVDRFASILSRRLLSDERVARVLIQKTEADNSFKKDMEKALDVDKFTQKEKDQLEIIVKHITSEQGIHEQKEAPNSQLPYWHDDEDEVRIKQTFSMIVSELRAEGLLRETTDAKTKDAHTKHIKQLLEDKLIQYKIKAIITESRLLNDSLMQELNDSLESLIEYFANRTQKRKTQTLSAQEEKRLGAQFSAAEIDAFKIYIKQQVTENLHSLIRDKSDISHQGENPNTQDTSATEDHTNDDENDLSAENQGPEKKNQKTQSNPNAEQPVKKTAASSKNPVSANAETQNETEANDSDGKLDKLKREDNPPTNEMTVDKENTARENDSTAKTERATTPDAKRSTHAAGEEASEKKKASLAQKILENPELFNKTVNNIWVTGVKTYLGFRQTHQSNYAEYPVFAIVREDVEEFIGELEDADPECNPETLSVETTSYRLPLSVEWQYAARAVTTAEKAKQFPHLSACARVPEKDKLMGFRLKKENFRVYDEPFYDEISDSSVNVQFTRLMNALIARDNKLGWALVQAQEGAPPDGEAGKKNRINRVRWTAFERIISEAVFGKSKRLKNINLAPVGNSLINHSAVGTINAWDIYHMLDNISELTQTGLAPTYAAHGGASGIDHGADLPSRNRWFIWSGYQTESDKSAFIRGLYGFRLVRTQGLSNRWFEAVRSDAFIDAKLDARKKRIAEKSKRIQQISRGEELADKVESISALYQGIAEANEGGDFITAEDIEPLAEEDPYFKYLARVIDK